MPEERVGFKYRLWRIVESTPFEYFIMTLIVLNTILLMMKVRQYQNLRCTTRGRSQTTFTEFLPFLTPPPPWLTSLLDKICQIYLVTLTFQELQIAVKFVNRPKY